MDTSPPVGRVSDGDSDRTSDGDTAMTLNLSYPVCDSDRNRTSDGDTEDDSDSELSSVWQW